MARVTTVQHARKDQGKCSRCGVPILKGDPYRHAAPGFRSRPTVRCMKPECSFRPSDLTTSKMGMVYAAQESAHDALDALGEFEDVGDVESILSDAANEAREVAQEYADAAEAMGGAGEELTEKSEMVESWCDELESPTFEDVPDKDDPEFEGDEAEDEFEEAMSAWRDAVLDEARSLIDGFEG